MPHASHARRLAHSSNRSVLSTLGPLRVPAARRLCRSLHTSLIRCRALSGEGVERDAHVHGRAAARDRGVHRRGGEGIQHMCPGLSGALCGAHARAHATRATHLRTHTRTNLRDQSTSRENQGTACVALNLVPPGPRARQEHDQGRRRQGQTAIQAGVLTRLDVAHGATTEPVLAWLRAHQLDRVDASSGLVPLPGPSGDISTAGRVA